MKFAACWRYESSFSKVRPLRTVGVFFNWISVKYHLFGPINDPDEPGIVVDAITPFMPSTALEKAGFFDLFVLKINKNNKEMPFMLFHSFRHFLTIYHDITLYKFRKILPLKILRSYSRIFPRFLIKTEYFYIFK